MKKPFVKIFLTVLIFGSLALCAPALTADKSPFIPVCLSKGTCDDVTVFVSLAISVGRYLFSFVGAVALLFFVYGGITMIVSHGNKEIISRGTKAMTAAVVGLIVAFSGYALITFLGKNLKLRGALQLNQSVEIFKV